MKLSQCIKFLAGLSMLVSINSGANGLPDEGRLPMYYSSCLKDANLKIPENSSGHIFSRDCKTVYVLSPKQSDFVINGTTVNPLYLTENHACNDIRDTNRIIKELPKVEPSRLLAKLLREVADIEAILEQDLTLDGMTLDETYVELEKVDERASKRLAAHKEKVEGVDSLSSVYFNSLSKYENKWGGHVSFSLVDTQDELLRAYIEQNEGSGFNFVQIASRGAHLYYSQEDNITGNDGKSAGLVDMGVMKRFLHGESSDESKGADGETLTSYSKSRVKFNGAVDGDLDLSVIGVCSGDEGVDISHDTVKTYVGVTKVEEFEAFIQNSTEMTYNVENFISIIKKQIKKGGILKTRSLNKLAEDRRQKKLFTLKTVDEDINDYRSNADRVKLRKAFMDQMLKEMLIIASGDKKIDPLQFLEAPKENGVDALASGIKKNCFHFYCQLGAAGLNVISKAFGSTENVTELTKRLKVEHKEILVGIYPIKLYTTSTFK